MLLLPGVALTWLMIASISAHSPPGVPPHQNVQEGRGQGFAGKGLKFQSEIHNADHIMEHLQHVIKTKPKEEMSEDELEFHYFKMHDYDNNNKLDGVEIGKALTHFHEDPEEDSTKEGQQGQQKAGEKRHYNNPEINEEELAEMIDEVLEEDDLDNDGYIDYSEFMKGQKRRGEYGDHGKPYNPDTL